MNLSKTLEIGIENFFANIWDDEKIKSRSILSVLLIPIVLSIAFVWFKLTYLDDPLPPFLSFFIVVLISICYGGIRGALIAIAVTTAISIGVIIYGINRTDEVGWLSMLTVLVYFIETIFFTALLHRIQLTEKRCKSQYKELLQTKNEIQERENRHEDFVHMATHELKAPVTVLKAYLQLAAMKVKNQQHVNLDPNNLIGDFNQLTEKMEFQLDKLVTLINDLSESSRIKSGALNCHMEPFNMATCISDCTEGFKAAHPEAIINLQHVDSVLMVNGDESRLEQVILNLLSNAVKYSNGVPEILVTYKQQGQHILVEVKDHGQGIPLEMQPAVFDRFYRVNSPEVKKSQGLGLGLYICAEIIKLHQGEIGVKSKLNEGATFWFTLPLQPIT